MVILIKCKFCLPVGVLSRQHMTMLRSGLTLFILLLAAQASHGLYDPHCGGNYNNHYYNHYYYYHYYYH